MRRAAPNQLAIAVVLIIISLVGASYWIDLNDPTKRPKKVEQVASAKTPEPKAEPLQVEFIPGLRNGQLAGAFAGNGRERLTLTLHNLATESIKTTLPKGLIFTTADNAAQVVCTSETRIQLKPNEEFRSAVPSAAIRMANVIGEHILLPSETRLPALEPLWPALDRLPDASPGTIQTAVLLLMEDPSLAAFATFPLAASEKPKGKPTDAFAVPTEDIIVALNILSKVAPEKGFGLIGSAQLRLEALINPKSHDAALMFYNIDRDQEWDFWRTELAHGDPSMRHYALYGIARYYPDIAYEMLPKWIGEARTPLVFRQHAAFALAEIPRPEALRALTKLHAQLATDAQMRPVMDKALSLAQARQTQVAAP
jgi:hypothetical protein